MANSMYCLFPNRFLCQLLLLCGMMSIVAIGCETNETSTKEEEGLGPHTSPVTEAALTGLDSLDEKALPMPSRALQPGDWFEDVTDRTGIRVGYQNGREADLYTIVETVGGGVAMIDYDQDGDLDLFIPGGGRITGPPPRFEGLPSALYRNDGEFRFVDVTAQAGLEIAGDYSLGCAVGDYDQDHFPDLLVTCYGTSRLYHNNRAGGFEDVTTTSGLSLDGFYTSAVWADVDRDGWEDLYIAGYVRCEGSEDINCIEAIRGVRDTCGPWHYPPLGDRLYRNRRDGTFVDITEGSGVRKDGKGLGVLATDIDRNGWIDFYVANDTVANHLYLGRADAKFDETGLVAGVSVGYAGTPEGSMGVDIGDFDGDGRGDLFVTNFEMEDNALYRAVSETSFADRTLQANLGDTCRRYVGFGTGFADFDLDGWLDLFVINGNVHYATGRTSYLQPAFIFQNRGGYFENVSNRAGPYFSVAHAGRGAAVGDLDDDGSLDLVIVHQNQPVTLLRNRLEQKGWARVSLRATDSAPNAVGATVMAEHGGRTLVRHVRAGSGYLSHFDQRILLPAVDDQPQQINVRWPSGRQEVFTNVPLRETTELVEGTGQNDS
ncbi:MAG: CRTAC1 family protein [Planctomycetales bacterium]|nr:CRTAC1 family protein [Planctomycetales bacterium]